MKARAIAALTSAARRERIIGAGTPNEHPGPVDFGEIACHVITASLDRKSVGRERV